MAEFDCNYYMGLESCWEYLKRTENPIFIYGMGDGALKILRQFDRYGIVCSGFFASDEFVRGHYFEGHLVHKLSEIERIIPDFDIVLGFAAGYNSLIEKIKGISKRHNVLAPDVPVAGETVFTKEFVKDNYTKFEKVYSLLCDEKSKKTYRDIIEFKITGDISCLYDNWIDVSESYNIIKPDNNEVYVDLGAYNGDTFKEFTEYTSGRYDKIFAFEPDRHNFKKLSQCVEGYKNVTALNCAAWSSDTELTFSDSSGRQAKLSLKGKPVEARSVDSVLDGEKATFIKLDVEGAEKEALSGCSKTITKYRPKIKCALYHRSEDMFELPLMINKLCPDYHFYIRQFTYIPAWEVNLLAIL